MFNTIKKKVKKFGKSIIKHCHSGSDKRTKPLTGTTTTNPPANPPADPNPPVSTTQTTSTTTTMRAITPPRVVEITNPPVAEVRQASVKKAEVAPVPVVKVEPVEPVQFVPEFIPVPAPAPMQQPEPERTPSVHDVTPVAAPSAVQTPTFLTPVEVNMATSTVEISPAKLNSNNNALFNVVQPLRIEFPDKPTAKVMEVADCMRMVFAKCQQDPAMPCELAEQYLTLTNAVYRLQDAVNRDETSRNYPTDNELRKEQLELAAKIESLKFKKAGREFDIQDRQQKIDTVKNLLQRQRELLETNPEEGIQIVKNENLKGYDQDMRELAAEVAKQPDGVMNFLKLNCQPCNPNSQAKLNKKIDEMKLNLKNIEDTDPNVAKDAARNILAYAEKVLQDAEAEKLSVTEIENELKEAQLQHELITQRIESTHDQANYEVSRDTMLQAIRVYEFVDRNITQMNTEDLTESQQSMMQATQKVFKEMQDDFITAAKGLKCPTMGNLDFTHFHNDFKALCDADKNAIVNGDINDVLLDNFMREDQATRCSLRAA